ncbi:hypothetical protein TNCT_181231 [Trichonephila clavata]|uniref:Uncharacterized protein n=2 Tax=Trichonephila clavata TaxID=2740835 RepID=A0A8X6M6T7_TRICU|nr:hypothetical protein TNCT_181231 [Trichonephila clavata]
MVALEICFCKRAPRFERKRQHATAAYPPRYGEDRRKISIITSLWHLYRVEEYHPPTNTTAVLSSEERYLFWQNIISWHPEYDMLNKKEPHENTIKRGLVPKPDQLNRQSSLGFYHRDSIDLRYTHDKVAKVSNYRNNAPLAKSSLDQGIEAKSVSPRLPSINYCSKSI